MKGAELSGDKHSPHLNSQIFCECDLYLLLSAPKFSPLFAALQFHKNRVTPFWHQTLQFTVYTSCYNSNMHGYWRSINLNAFKRILVNKRTIHYDVTTQNFFIRRPPQSRHSSPNLPSLSIYQYVCAVLSQNQS